MNRKVKIAIIVIVCLLPVFFTTIYCKKWIFKHLPIFNNKLMSLDDPYIENVPVNKIIRRDLEYPLLYISDEIIFFALYFVSKFKKSFIDNLDLSGFKDFYRNQINSEYNIDIYDDQEFEPIAQNFYVFHKKRLFLELEEISLNFKIFKKRDYLVSKLKLIFSFYKKNIMFFNNQNILDFVRTNSKNIDIEFKSTNQIRNEALNSHLLTFKIYLGVDENSREKNYTFIDIVLSILTYNIINYIDDDVIDEIFSKTKYK